MEIQIDTAEIEIPNILIPLENVPILFEITMLTFCIIKGEKKMCKNEKGEIQSLHFLKFQIECVLRLGYFPEFYETF